MSPVASSATATAQASSGTPIPLGLYTDIQCTKPSISQPNVSLPLDECAVTLGLGSLTLPDVLCADNNVQVWAFTDIACSDQDYIFNLGNNCEGRATSGTYRAIMLSCNENEPGTPTATTTISVGPVATAGSSAASTSSSPSATASSQGSSTSSSGWGSFSTGIKVGIVVGSFVALLMVLSFLGWLNRGCRPKTNPSTMNSRTGQAASNGQYETPSQRQMRYAGYGIAMNNMNYGGGGA